MGVTAEIVELKQSKADAEDDLRKVMRVVPSLEVERDALQTAIDKSTESAINERKRIRIEARRLSRTMDEGKLGGELLTERKLLQGTSEELLDAAQEIAEANRKAQEAFQQACEERSRASSGFTDFQEAMTRHLRSLKSQESFMSQSLDEQKEMELKLNSLLGSAE